MECAELQEYLTRLELWARDWLLKFNTSKCKVMHCGSSNPGHDYYMNTIAGDPMVLQKALEEKVLGVSITSSLKPTVHCQKAASKAMSSALIPQY